MATASTHEPSGSAAASADLPRAEPARSGLTADTLPDTRLFWLWVGRALRPYAGWIIATAGLCFIIGGYLGLSGESLVAKQLPYLISGGIFGIALVGIGAAYVAVEQIRRDSDRLDRLERMVLELHSVLLTMPDAPPIQLQPGGWYEAAYDGVSEGQAASSGGLSEGQGVSRGRVTSNGTGPLVALPVGQSFHRPDCSMVAGKDNVERVTSRMVRNRGLRPCRLCEPDPVDARA
jgi:hypothetical protein